MRNVTDENEFLMLDDRKFIENIFYSELNVCSTVTKHFLENGSVFGLSPIRPCTSVLEIPVSDFKKFIFMLMYSMWVSLCVCMCVRENMNVNGGVNVFMCFVQQLQPFCVLFEQRFHQKIHQRSNDKTSKNIRLKYSVSDPSELKYSLPVSIRVGQQIRIFLFFGFI